MTFVTVVRRWGLLVLGFIGMIAGAILLMRPAPAAAFGWTAYAPLTDAVYVPSFLTSTFVLGAALLLLGLALVAGWVGFVLGTNSRIRASRRNPSDA